MRFLILVLLSASFLSKAQEVTNLIYGDTTYMYPEQAIYTDPKTYQRIDSIGYFLKSSLPDGIYKIHYKENEQQLYLEAELKDHQKWGLWEYWNRNGNRSKQIYYDITGEKHQLVLWYPNGNKEIETLYYKDHFDGPIISWYKNGQIKSIGTYVYHRKHGLFMKWYANGKKRSEKFYHLNKETGTWQFWDENGILVKQEFYMSGRLMRTKTY